MKKETPENHGMLIKGQSKQREKHSTVRESENVETVDPVLWYL